MNQPLMSTQHLEVRSSYRKGTRRHSSLLADGENRYLTFSTHSGYTNQLMQLLNGLALGFLLNATVVLPAMHLKYAHCPRVAM